MSSSKTGPPTPRPCQASPCWPLSGGWRGTGLTGPSSGQLWAVTCSRPWLFPLPVSVHQLARGLVLHHRSLEARGQRHSCCRRQEERQPDNAKVHEFVGRNPVLHLIIMINSNTQPGIGIFGLFAGGKAANGLFVLLHGA